MSHATANYPSINDEGGDLHSSHRRLSSDGQLTLSIDGRGYFQYRLRTSNTAMADDSQARAGAGPGKYDNAYMVDDDAADSAAVDITVAAEIGSQIAGEGAAAASFVVVALPIADILEGEKVTVSATGAAGVNSCAAAGDYTVGSGSTAIKLVVREAIPVQDAGDLCEVVDAAGSWPQQNRPSDPGNQRQADANGVEDTNESDPDAESQVVYSRDGSMHVNKYGYLVDDNGLLLVIADSPASNGISSSSSSDPNAKFHAHIPSRATGLIVTPTGKILAREGSSISIVGQINLIRFENPDGLDVKLRMKSNCAAANEDGFALGTWCEGSELDGKQHIYMAETAVSGPGILGKPGDQGFGRLSN